MNTAATGIKGVGISYRAEFAPFQERLEKSVDCVEVLFEQTFTPGFDGADVLAWDVPKAAHALTFSPARSDFRVEPATEDLFASAREHGVTMISDHLSFSAVGEFSVPNFFSCRRTAEEAARIAANLRLLGARARMSVAVENAVTFLSDPGDEMSEVAFVNHVLASADCGMLLDVNNLYINAVNHKYDPNSFVDQLDRERISYVHVAGHDELGGVLVDSHGADVTKEVWDLLAYTLRRSPAVAVILERDNMSATEGELLKELSVMREIWTACRRS